jgi:hypothetical protein
MVRADRPKTLPASARRMIRFESGGAGVISAANSRIRRVRTLAGKVPINTRMVVSTLWFVDIVISPSWFCCVQD